MLADLLQTHGQVNWLQVPRVWLHPDIQMQNTTGHIESHPCTASSVQVVTTETEVNYCPVLHNSMVSDCNKNRDSHLGRPQESDVGLPAVDKVCFHTL